MSADDSVVNNNEVDNTNPGAPVEDGSRGFLVLAALLTGTLLLLSLFAVGYLLLGRADGRAAEVAAIETQNAVILATNAAVTETIAAMNSEATSRAISAVALEGDTATPLPAGGEENGAATAATAATAGVGKEKRM